MGYCKECYKRGKTWEGSDPICAFNFKTYTPNNNWNCATINLIRDICYEGQKLKPGIDYQYCDDMKYATIKVDGLDIEHNPLALWISWYKNRGSTNEMWLLFDDRPPRHPTEDELLVIYNRYK